MPTAMSSNVVHSFKATMQNTEPSESWIVFPFSFQPMAFLNIS